MLRWANYPDAVFYELVSDALEFTEEIIGTDGPSDYDAIASYGDAMPRCAKIFQLEQIRPLLIQIRNAHRDATTMYQCTDYHWLVLYEALGFFLELSSNEGPIKAGPYRIKNVEWNAILDHYFWDLDFTIDEIKDASEFVKSQMGVSPETWGLVSGFKPHPEEIALRPSGDWGPGPFPAGRGPRSGRIATYPPQRMSRQTEWFYG